MQNGKASSSQLARFNRKVSFHLQQSVPCGLTGRNVKMESIKSLCGHICTNNFVHKIEMENEENTKRRYDIVTIKSKENTETIRANLFLKTYKESNLILHTRSLRARAVFSRYKTTKTV